jgi:hypothetical protein
MLKSTLYKSLKHIKLKVTPTCFGSHEIHHQGVQSCTWLKLLAMVHRHLSCARSVFGSIILNLWRVCTVRQVENYSSSQPETKSIIQLVTFVVQKNVLWTEVPNNVSIQYYHSLTEHKHAEYQSLTGCLDRANIFDPTHFILVWNEWKLTCLIISFGLEDWNPHDSHKQAYTPAKYT